MTFLDTLDIERSTASRNRFLLVRECISIRRAIYNSFGALGNASANWRLRVVSKTRVAEPRKRVTIAMGPALRETGNFAIKLRTIVLVERLIRRDSSRLGMRYLKRIKRRHVKHLGESKD